jgi:hypothetical protein
MPHIDTEVIFPSRLIPVLRDVRGEEWRALVDLVLSKEAFSEEHLAFVLMMVRLSGCQTCHGDTFRALRGCTSCSNTSLKRFRGSDHELLVFFHEARQEIERYISVNDSIIMR